MAHHTLAPERKKLLFIATPGDERYYQRFEELTNGSSVRVFSGKIDTGAEIATAARRLGVDAIVTTREDYIKKLLPPGKVKNAKLSNYAGSLIPTNVEGMDVLVLPPLDHIIKVAHGRWMTERMLSKVTTPEVWRKSSKFQWKWVKSQQDYQEAREYLAGCFLVSIDIETTPPNIIRCISYCGFTASGESCAFVFQLNSLAAVGWMRELNATPVPKVCQNGKYECAHFFAYSAPMVNYIADTKNAMHSWMVELPKDLAFLSALLIRDVMYWKDLGNSGDLVDLLHYNALDTWTTGEAFLTWMKEAPKWSKQNYIQEFSLVPTSHMCEMRGIKQDIPLADKFREEGEEQLESLLSSLQTCVATPNFNPNSYKQVRAVMFALGCGSKDKKTGKYGLPTESDEPALKSAMLKHPLNEVVFGKILEYRGEAKIYSTYLPAKSNRKDFKGRILYALNPDGTDSGRFASKEHHFWTGLQVQNIPGSGTGLKVKQTFIADDGYEIGEADYSQADARGVAYCSGDAKLLSAIESGQDFHSLNASAFFGIPYEQIYDDKNHKTLDKELRDLSKRVNHGANYNMAEHMLLHTMGETNVRRAQLLLKLPRHWNLVDVCKYLLHRYAVTYPTVKTRYYAWIVKQVMMTQKLVGPTGWTRYCFGNPAQRKPDLNAYVAHYTQSLTAMIINEAMRRITRWQIRENNWTDIQILAQIHDSILFQVKKGRRDLAEKLQELMTFPVPVTDCTGVSRDMIIPVDVKLTGHRWGGPLKEELAA